MRPRNDAQCVDTRTGRKRPKFSVTIGMIAAALTAGAITSAFAAPAMATSHNDDYRVVVWQKPSTGDWPQTYAASATLDQKSVSKGLKLIDVSKLQCGASFQVDLYNNDYTTTVLVNGGVLYGSGNPAESWPGGYWKSEYTTYLTTDACPTPPPTTEPPAPDYVTPVTPVVSGCADDTKLSVHGVVLTPGGTYAADGGTYYLSPSPFAGEQELFFSPDDGKEIQDGQYPNASGLVGTDAFFGQWLMGDGGLQYSVREPECSIPTYVAPVAPGITGCGEDTQVLISGTPINGYLETADGDYVVDYAQDAANQSIPIVRVFFTPANGKSIDIPTWESSDPGYGQWWWNGAALQVTFKVVACESTPTSTPTPSDTPTVAPSTTPSVTPSTSPSPKPSATYPVASPTDGSTPMWQQPAFAALSGIILLAAAGVGFLLKRRGTTTH